MKLKYCALPLAAALALFASASSAEEPPQKPEQVSIKFDWPAGLTAQISATKSKSRSKDGGDPTVNEMSTRYTMTTARKGTDLLVSYGDLELDPKALQAMPEEQRRLMSVMTQAGLPSYLISKDGDFLALENYEGLISATRRMLGAAIPDASTRQRMQPMMDQLLSLPVLTGIARGEWDWMVGTWTGAEQSFDIGDEYVSKSQVQIPILANEPIETQTHFTFKRKLPCERGGVTRECVELVALNEPNAEKLTAAIEKFLNKMSPAMAAKGHIDTMTSEIHIELVAETATLLPHRFSLRKDIGATGTENGKKTATEAIEKMTLEFSYPTGK